MLESGYVRIFRSFLNWEWYDDANTMRVFLHLILTANWEPKEWHGKEIQRGQRVTSYASLSSELKISVKSVRTAINHLKRTGEVAILTTHEYSIITIKNYEMYQDVANQTANEGQTSGKAGANEGQQLKKDNKDKNDKKDKEIAEIPYSEIQKLYSSICKSYPKLTKLSDSRKKAIHARFAAGYKLDDFKRLFEMAEASPFLKGQNNRNWSATFDWLIKDANMAKVLDGNYIDKQQEKAPEHTPTFDLDEYERESVYDTKGET